MIEGFNHVGTAHQCNVCQCDYTDDEGGVEGYLGILPVAFCPTCFAGLCDMVGQLNERDWDGLSHDEIMELIDKYSGINPNLYLFAQDIETTLKEKNCD